MIKKYAFMLLMPLLSWHIALCAHTFPLNSTAIFKGDRHNQFQGDYVAILEDGSAWKVHPEDRSKYEQWLPGESIHPQVRTSFYWFKREHKFELNNQSRNESVRAMLVQYPTYPLFITQSYQVENGGYFRPKKIIDSSGNQYIKEEWEPTFETQVHLNDGSIWRVGKGNVEFQEQHFVYIGIQANTESFQNFLISGTERENKFFYVKQLQ